MSIEVVLGPPVAGKSEYVKAHARDGNVIIDYDLIARAMGSRVAHDSSGSVRIVALESRKSAIERILRGLDDDAWIIHTNPQPRVMQAYVDAGAKFTMLDPGKDEVLRRAKDRPASTAEAIEAWYANPPVIPEPTAQKQGRPVMENNLQQAFDRGFETVKSYIDAELAALKSREPIPGPPGERGEPGPQGPQGAAGEISMLVPPDLAAEVARALRALHEAPLVERNDAPARVVRIERDDDGNMVPIYET